jgi:hypothetical protein
VTNGNRTIHPYPRCRCGSLGSPHPTMKRRSPCDMQYFVAPASRTMSKSRPLSLLLMGADCRKSAPQPESATPVQEQKNRGRFPGSPGYIDVFDRYYFTACFLTYWYCRPPSTQGWQPGEAIVYFSVLFTSWQPGATAVGAPHAAGPRLAGATHFGGMT